MAKTFTIWDKVAGGMLLVLAIMVMFAPDFEVTGQTIRTSHVGTTWIPAGILLLLGHMSPRPSPVWTRWVAASLFIAGFASPFVANFIDQSLGA